MSFTTLRAGFALAAILLVFCAGLAQADDLKIGFIDSERIFAEFEGTKSAQSEFNAQLEQWTRDLEARRAEYEQMVADYESQALILSDPKKREREEELTRKRSELEAMAQEIWGPNGKVAQRNEELTRPIVEKIREVLKRIGEAEKFSIIFDATDGNVVYADDALDLTSRVVEELNAAAANR